MSLTLRLTALFALTLLSAAATPAQSSPPLTLDSLERMALANHPALASAQSRIRAAQGRQLQAGLYPNPTVGYNGDEISAGSVIRGGEHGFFAEQTIVTAGKLRKNRAVASQDRVLTEAHAEITRQRVLTAVRQLYYEALAAERILTLRTELAAISTEAVAVTRQLFNTGAADQPDLLDAEVESQRADLARLRAEHDRERVWRQLAAAAGNPALPISPLAGSLDEPAPALDFDATLATLLRDSPELTLARHTVTREESEIARARAEWIPDVTVRGGIRYNRELLETGGRPVGLEGFADIGVQIPLFNRNQGAVAAARAESDRAKSDAQRAELALRIRLAAAFRTYRDAAAIAARYRDEMLPRARQAHDLYKKKYEQMAAAYPQVLVARRSALLLEEEYVESQKMLWTSITSIRGFLLPSTMD